MAYLRWLVPRSLISVPLLIVLIVAAACGGAEEPTSAPPAPASTSPATAPDPVEAATAPADASTAEPVGAVVPEWVQEGSTKHYKGVFPVVASTNPGFWDVHYGGSMNTTLVPSGPRFNQLLEYDPVNPTVIIGDLAASWELNEAGDVYIFRLKDAKFSDGTSVTAEDVVFSLDRITLPGALRARTGFLKRFYEHKTGEVIDEKTVRVPLTAPSASFFPNLASDYMKIYPKALENVSQEDFNCCPEKTFGSGPWIFQDWKKDSSYTFERNPNYFKSPRPYFDGLKVFLIRAVARRIAAVQTGQALSSYQPWAFNAQDAQLIERETNGQVRAVLIKGVVIQNFWLNISVPPFDNLDVRRAMYLAIDRQKIIDLAWDGFAVQGTFFKPGVVETLDELVNIPGYRADKSEDTEEARQLLTDAGFSLPIEISLNVVSPGANLATAEVVTEQLRTGGLFEITISPKDLATFYVEMRDGVHDMDLVTTGIILGDPGDIINQYFDTNVLRNAQNWTDPRTDAIIARQDLELDHDKRIAMFREFAEILREGTSHMVPLNWTGSAAAMDYRLRNYYVPSTIQLVHKWDHVWFDPDRKMPEVSGYVP